MSIGRAVKAGVAPGDLDSRWIDASLCPDDGSITAMHANRLAYQIAVSSDVDLAGARLESALRATASASAPERRSIMVEAAIFQGWCRQNRERMHYWAAPLRNADIVPFDRLRLDVVTLWCAGEREAAIEKLADAAYAQPGLSAWVEMMRTMTAATAIKNPAS